jgi:uncharacterized protein YdhG (YjbR/CyaY superfamily)
VTFAAFKKAHRLLPDAVGDPRIQAGPRGVQDSAGTVQFPYDRPLPKALITRITKFRVRELRARDAKWMTR